MSMRAIPQRGINLDYLMWIFTRISGLALILLALIGFFGAFYMGARLQMDMSTLIRWTFFPNSNHVVSSEVPDITLGWANAYWQIMQILIVFFAVSHGINGLRTVVEDYIGQSIWRILLRGLILLLWLFFLIVGIYVIQSS